MKDGSADIGVKAMQPETVLQKQKSAFGLQSRFLLGLACIFILFCIFIATLIYFHEKRILEEETFRKTELVAAAVESTREYVREVLRPKMYEVLDDETFVIEAMSTSYISRVVMDRFKEHLPEFQYRRVAITARNPDYEANDLERKMIRYFIDQPDADKWYGIVKTEQGRYYMSFRPVRFTGPCFYCHGDPEDAPQTIVDNYGDTLGFHRKPGEVGGVQSVGIPVDFGLRQIMDVAWAAFFAAFLVVFFLYGIIWFFFNKLVVQNLHQLLDIFRDNLRDEQGVRLYEQARSKDEIAEMSVAVQSVARHVREAHGKLEDYAQNLERKVAERTSALENSRKRLREQVAERSLELRTFNAITELVTRSIQLADILPRVLQEVLKVVPAKGAGIYLLDRKLAALRLQCALNGEELDEEISFDPSLCLAMLDRQTLDFEGFIREAAQAHLNRAGSAPGLSKGLKVPLCCHGQVLGVMIFLGINVDEMGPEQHELLYSIGHQIGITIESLQNIASLVESKGLLQSVFDGISDGVVLLDHEHQIRMVNRAFLQRLDIDLDQVLDRPLDGLPLKNYWPSLFSAVDYSFPAGRATERVFETDEGLVYAIRLYPIFADGGTVRNIVCYLMDITEQKQVERSIQQTEKLVALGQLAAGVAHEINNPLGVILCYADILKEEVGEGTGQLRDDVAIIEKHARSCQRIVTDLLNFARGQKMERRPDPINRVIEDVVTMVEQQFSKKRIDFLMELAPDLPELLIDSDRMRQVFLNLVMNASHAIGENGTIRINSRHLAGEKQVQVVVEDNGGGIEPDLLAKIFDPFFTTKPQGTGTGLGLSVSYGIIRDHGGDIRVESRYGEWTRFIITLPAWEEQETELPS
jgi:two-component system, NtrC family, sensor kinase